MPRKLTDLDFLKNQLRWFMAAKGRYSPSPATRFRAMLALLALNKFVDDKVIHDLSDPSSPRLYRRGQDAQSEGADESVPEVDEEVQAMLTQAAKDRNRGDHAKLPQSRS